MSVIVKVPVAKGLVNSMFPLTEKVLVNRSQPVGLDVIAMIEQLLTILQFVTPVLLAVCENVIIPEFPLKFERRRIYISPTWAFDIWHVSVALVEKLQSVMFPLG